MSRKEDIKSVKKLIAQLETSMNYQPETSDEFRDYDRKVRTLEDAKKQLRNLLYTEEERKYQDRLDIISSNKEIIHKLEVSTNYEPSTKDEYKDFDSKIQLLHDYRQELSETMNSINNDYVINPLRINVEELDSNFCIAFFDYGSETQKKAVKEMFDLRLIEEYGSLSESEFYIRPYLEYGKVITKVIIPKEIAFPILNELISVPNTRIKIGNKKMMSQVDYNDMIEALGIVGPIKCNLELYGQREDGSLDWKISFVYDSKSQVERIYSDFENKYIPELGFHSNALTEYGEYIKPALAEDSIYGPHQISYVIVPELLLRNMAEHLINDNGVILNVGDQKFVGEYDNNSFIESLDSLIDKAPKL